MKKNTVRKISLLLAVAMTNCILQIGTANNVSAATLLSAEFETTNDSFTGRGNASVAWTSDRSYSDKCSLFVSERTAAWNGASRDASSILSAGQTYAISAAVYQESGEPVEMKFSLQYEDSTGTVNYDAIVLETAEDSTWTLLENSAYTVPSDAKNLSIYVETTESLTDFYVDLVTVSGAPSVIKPGDADGDLSVTIKDLTAMKQYLLGVSEEIEPGADLNENGSTDVYDLSLLKYKILNPKQSPSVEGDWDNYQETATPQMLQVYNDALYRIGNTARIRDKISKAQNGEQVNIAYLGGSITGGGSSSSPSNCFANLSYQYFSETFGCGNNVNYINAGMAGTSSVVGNLRVDNDVFSKNADVIFIEFAVNDQGGERFQKSYESLVKKCLSQENEPAVVIVTLCTQSGSSCQDWMAKIAENYDLPVISGKDAVMNAITAGTLSWSDYGSGDTIHPGDGGHKLIADSIAYYYRQALRSENNSEAYEIPSTSVFGSEYSTARLITVDEMQNLSTGSWTSGTNNPSYSANGFTFSKNGNNPLTFSVEGKGIILLFQSNSNDSMGTANVTVNSVTTPVSSNLPYTWGGLDGDIAYYQPESALLNVSISMDNPSTNFVLYGIAVVS
ncbi:MAG: carbohydrate binding domain-containing protein [Oscillospiraceae bacterium]